MIRGYTNAVREREKAGSFGVEGQKVMSVRRGWP
jgi:hypothetical protein